MTEPAPKSRSSRSWRRRTIVAVVVLLACLGAYRLGLGRKPVENGGLTVTPADRDFGVVWENDAFRWTVPLQNPTSQDVEITAFEPTCTCLSFEPKALLIPPGQTEEVHLTLNLMHSGPEEIGLPLRDFSVQLVPRIKSNLPRQQGWAIHGKVRCACDLAPPFLDFWDSVMQGQPSPAKKAQVQGHCSLRDLVTKFDRSKVCVAVSRRLGAADAFDLEVAPAPSLPAGPFSAEVQVQPIGTDGVARQTKTLRIEGMVQGDVQASPAQVAFGVKKIGREAAETVVFRSRAGQSLALDSIDALPSDLQITPLDSKDGPAVRLTQRFSQPGSQTAIVKFVIRRRPGGTPLVVPVEVSYYGLPE